MTPVCARAAASRASHTQGPSWRRSSLAILTGEADLFDRLDASLRQRLGAGAGAEAVLKRQHTGSSYQIAIQAIRELSVDSYLVAITI